MEPISALQGIQHGVQHGMNMLTDRIGLIPNHPTQHQRDMAIETDPDAFSNFFRASLEMFNETNRLQNASDTAQINFATGQDTNMLTVILAQQRANSALEFTVQVTSRIVEAYREIMRMQI